MKKDSENKQSPFAGLEDGHKRYLNYLRVSITDRCNLRCLYCVPDGRIPKLRHDDILTYEEILRIIKIGIDLGIRKVRITGGEPLVRKGAIDFLRQLTRLDKLEDISLTTNGVLLKSKARQIFDAGIRRINVSLDTLDRDKYAHITGYDRFEEVWRGIRCAEKLGFDPIKINVVAMRGINDDEFVDFGRLSLSTPFHIRFIEYMPIGSSRNRFSDQILTPEIQEKLETIGPLTAVERAIIDGPARRYRFAGAPGEVGFISALSHHFCGQCNRLRLTADGKLRACLLSDHHTPLKGVLRDGGSDEELAAIFRDAVKQKAARHQLMADGIGCVRDPMQGIGG